MLAMCASKNVRATPKKLAVSAYFMKSDGLMINTLVDFNVIRIGVFCSKRNSSDVTNCYCVYPNALGI